MKMPGDHDRLRRFAMFTTLLLMLVLPKCCESSAKSHKQFRPPVNDVRGGVSRVDAVQGAFARMVNFMTHLAGSGLVGLSRKEVMEQCYGKYGCFSIDYPWLSSHRVVQMFPRGPDKIWPEFHLFTRKNPKRHQKLSEGNYKLLHQSYFDPHKMTFVITHGYLEHVHKGWLNRLKHELLVKGDFNVIVMGWLTGSGPPYMQAVANIRMLGTQAAHFFAFMHHAGRLNLHHTHAIGHSLGAHLCGYLGSALQKHFGLELGRITGLDPAEPMFEWADPITRLDPTDAYFVDVIHTDGSPIMSMGLGMYQACGHLDFYPNGGKIMSGCERTIKNSLIQEHGNAAYALRRFLGCNHIRAYEYFIESINSKCPFIGVECPSWDKFASGDCNGCLQDGDPYACEFMGFNAFAKYNGTRPKHQNRNLYLLTAPEKPFCAIHYRITIVLSDTPISKKQHGDRGNFYMVLHGEDSSSTLLKLNPEEAYFEAGRVYHFMAISHDLGHVHSADLVWQYMSHPLNPLTWRLTTDSVMYVNRIDIEEFGNHHKHTFCADDRPFYPDKPQNVVWKPTCRDNAPDPGSDFLGTVLNADPVGRAKFLFSQVNPLEMNPLNGLGMITNAVTGFTDTVQGMSSKVRRLGSDLTTRAFQLRRHHSY